MKKIMLFLLGYFFVFSAFAVEKFQPKQDVDYTVIANSTVTKSAKADKVNVKEFFAFTCIHCKDLEEPLGKLMSVNRNIKLDKIYVIWNDDPAMKSFGKLNATIQVLNLNKLYLPVFTAIFNRQNLTDPIILKNFLSSNGFSKPQIDNFFNVYNSFDVDAIVGKYKSMTLDPKYKIEGTPTIIVADKYIVNAAPPAELIKVTNALVNKVKTEK